MKKNKLLIILSAVVLVLAALFTLFLKPLLERDRYVYKETKAERGDLVLGIQESGTLTMKEEAISYEVEIEEDSDDESDDDEEENDEEEEEEQYLRVEEIYVASGQDVKAGEKLMKFTDSSVTAVRRKLERLKTEAEVALVEAKSEYNVGLISAKSAYDTGLLASDSAQSVYQAQKSAADAGLKQLQQKLVVLQGEIDDLKEELEDGEFWNSYKTAQKEYNAAKEEWEEANKNSPAGYNAAYSDYLKAKSSFDNLQDQVDKTNQSIDDKQHEMLKVQEEINGYGEILQKDHLSAEQNKQTSESDGTYAEAIYGYTADSLSESVTAAENALAEASLDLEAFETFVGDDNTVVATEDGKIISVLYEEEDEIRTTGDLFTYTTGSEDTITVNLAEEDIVDIRVGDFVSIEFTAYPDEIYEGIIEKIETKTADGFASTVNYPVTLLVLGDTSGLYGGMVADVTFAVETKENVIYVSKNAIVKQDDGDYVYCKNSLGKMELIPVTTGFSNGVSVEITEGLSEGDTVYIASKVSAEQSGQIN